jgi:hypothetical protein
MAEKEFRILPITMSTIFWIMYVLWHGSGTRMAWYTITSLQQGTNDLVRSVLCCSSLGVVCLKVAWEISRATSILLEQEVWWIYIQYLKIVWFVLALGMCAPLGYIVWKDWQKFKEARESWKQHQRLSQAESGAEEKSN